MTLRALVALFALGLLASCQQATEPERRLVLAQSGIPIHCSRGGDAEFEMIERSTRDHLGFLQRSFSQCQLEMVVPERARLSFRVALDSPGGPKEASVTVALHSQVAGRKEVLFRERLGRDKSSERREVSLPAGASTLSFWVARGWPDTVGSDVAWTDLEIATASPEQPDGLPWTLDVERGLVPHLEAIREPGPPRGDRPRLLVIGIDGASWDLMEPLLQSGDMPALAGLRARGRWGVLRSTIIPESGMGWAAMRTGVNSGKSGVYSFYSGSGNRKSFWHFLGDRGLTSVVVAVPTAWTKRPVRGVLIGGWSRVQENAWAWPPDLIPVLERVGYTPEMRGERNPDAYVKKIELRTEVASALLRHTDWDLGFVVYEYSDTVGHRFGLYTKEWDAVYRALDENLARLLRLIDERTAVMVVSDHGWKAYDRSIRLADWLQENGLGGWRVNWPASGSTLTISRDKESIAAPPKSRSTHMNDIRRIEAGLLELRDPDTGERVIRRVRSSEQPFSGRFRDRALGRLIVEADERYALNHTSPISRKRRRSRVFAGSRDTHSYDGVYLFAAPGVDPGEGGEESIFAIAPTVLAYFGIEPPADFDGRSLIDFGSSTATVAQAPTELYFESSTAEPGPTDGEISKDFEDDLRALGYIE